MKKWTKRIIWFCVILFVLFWVVIGVTIYQAKQVYNIINSEGQDLRADIFDVMDGNCSKILKVESDVAKVKIELKKSCANPFLHYIIEKNAPGNVSICEEVENPENILETAFKTNIEEVKANCTANNISIG